jgi:S-DNA-T family DNA segregation ATPase FtsK/SpoIIIE
MGKNAFGETHVVDLAGMPHMLVAGATGAGKSVFINTLLVSLIVKKSPKDLKLDSN